MLAATERWQQQNVGSNRTLAATERWQQQNVGSSGMLAADHGMQAYP